MTDPKNPKKTKVPEKSLPVKKETVKDMTVQPGKAKGVVGGGGGSPSRPKTGTNYTCTPC